MSSSDTLRVPSRPGSVHHRRSNIGRAFKRWKAALQNIGGSGKELPTSVQHSTSQESNVVIRQTLVVGDGPVGPSQPFTHDGTSIDLVSRPTPHESVERVLAKSPVYVRSEAQRERARALFLKYGLGVEAHEWTPATLAVPTPTRAVMRVEKSIRMRVRHTCHQCQFTFGASRECRQCHHIRCRQCPRIPRRKQRPRFEENKENSLAVDSDGELNDDRVMGGIPPMQSWETSPADQAQHESISCNPPPVAQRIRCSCHKCEAEFPTDTAQLCSNCGHLRCSRCIRELTSAGAFGEEEMAESETMQSTRSQERVYRKPRQRVRWICDVCSAVFLEGSKVCRECLHRRCDFCSRIPPKGAKVEPDPNMLFVESMPERLADGTASQPTALPLLLVSQREDLS